MIKPDVLIEVSSGIVVISRLVVDDSVDIIAICAVVVISNRQSLSHYFYHFA